MWVTKSKSIQICALEHRHCSMFPPQTSWRRTKSTRLQRSYCFIVCVCQPEDLVHGGHALQHCLKTGRVIWQVCACSLNRGVCETLTWGHTCLSRLTPHYRALHIFSRGFSLNANIGIMKEPKCLLLPFYAMRRTFLSHRGWNRILLSLCMTAYCNHM